MKYKIVMVYNGVEDEVDDVFDTESEAEEYAVYLCGCYHEGAEILNLSNPGDYPPDDEDDEPTYYIEEIDE